MLHLSQDDIAFLKPPQEAQFLQHPPEYIKSGIDADARRKIFYGVDLDAYEHNQVELLRQEISAAGITLNNTWSERELLKYLYSTNFNTKKAVDVLKDCLRWRSDVHLLPVTDKTLEVLHSGVIYPLGRDSQYRPILIINLDKLDPRSMDKNELGVVLTFFFDSLKQYSFVQGKVENLILIIDAANKEFLSFPMDKLEFLVKRLIASYPTILERTYILNPSTSFLSEWEHVKELFDKDALDKVQFLNISETNKLQEKIPANQLEIKYGGTISNVNIFWPISSIGTQVNPYGFKPLAKSQVFTNYEFLPVQNNPPVHERYSASGATGPNTYFDFDSNEQKKIFERKTMAFPTSEYRPREYEPPKNYDYERVVKSVPPKAKKSARNDVEGGYDFNDDDLLDLIVGENEQLKVVRASLPKTTITDTLLVPNPNRSSYTNISPKQDYPNGYQNDAGKKSYVYQETTSQVNDEWSKRKLIRPIDDYEDDDYEETRVDFCGLCVSNRRKPKY